MLAREHRFRDALLRDQHRRQGDAARHHVPQHVETAPLRQREIDDHAAVAPGIEAADRGGEVEGDVERDRLCRQRGSDDVDGHRVIEDEKGGGVRFHDLSGRSCSGARTVPPMTAQDAGRCGRCTSRALPSWPKWTTTREPTCMSFHVPAALPTLYAVASLRATVSFVLPSVCVTTIEVAEIFAIVPFSSRKPPWAKRNCGRSSSAQKRRVFRFICPRETRPPPSFLSDRPAKWDSSASFVRALPE